MVSVISPTATFRLSERSADFNLLSHHASIICEDSDLNEKQYNNDVIISAKKIYLLMYFVAAKHLRSYRNFPSVDSIYLSTFQTALLFYKLLTPFWKTFLSLKQSFDAKLLSKDYHISVFQKL